MIAYAVLPGLELAREEARANLAKLDATIEKFQHTLRNGSTPVTVESTAQAVLSGPGQQARKRPSSEDNEKRYSDTSPANARAKKMLMQWAAKHDGLIVVTEFAAAAQSRKQLSPSFLKTQVYGLLAHMTRRGEMTKVASGVYTAV